MGPPNNFNPATALFQFLTYLDKRTHAHSTFDPVCFKNEGDWYEPRCHRRGREWTVPWEWGSVNPPCVGAALAAWVLLLRKKTYGGRTFLCTPVLLEIKPELGKFLKSYLRTNKLELRNSFQAKLPSCLQWHHKKLICVSFPYPMSLALVLILLLFAICSKQESKINLSTFTRLNISFFAVKKSSVLITFLLTLRFVYLFITWSGVKHMFTHTHTRW